MAVSPVLMVALSPRGLTWQAGSVVNGSFVEANQPSTLNPDVTMEERHSDDVVITEHPVEQGSVISDHIYKLPAHLSLVYDWAAASPQNSSQDPGFLRNIYSQVLQLQANATLFQVITGKRLYKNMAIKNIITTSDKATENILDLRLEMQEVLMAVTTSVTTGAFSQQANPSATGATAPQGTVQLQPAPNYNPNASVAGGG